MKICYVCKIEKQLDLFKKSKREKDGLSNICKMCHVKKTLEYRSTKILKNNTDKKCRRCKITKTINKFSPYAHNKNLIRNICRECCNEDRRKIVEKNNLSDYYKASKNNQYSLKICKTHGKLNYKDIGLQLNHAHNPTVVTMICYLCNVENQARKFNDDNLIINTINSIIKCHTCFKEKYIFDFYKSELKRNTPSCRQCLNVRSKKNSEKYKLKKYGLSVTEFEQMIANQNGLCMICKLPETHKYKQYGNITKLSVDHCHSTGKVRALLCRNCNIIIGNAKESPQSLRAAANYLEEHL